MKPFYLGLSLLLSTIVSIASVHAQQNAVTDDGRRVILYMDGTWEYALSYERPGRPTEVNGKNVSLRLNDELMIWIEDGKMVDFSVLHDDLRLYDKMDGRLKRIGDFEIEYDFHTERIKRIGPYAIDYDFHTDKIKKIGDYPIKYDFHTDKISQIGNTYFEYSFFNEKLTEVRGHTPGVEINFY